MKTSELRLPTACADHVVADLGVFERLTCRVGPAPIHAARRRWPIVRH